MARIAEALDVIPLRPPVALGSPDQQAKPDGHADQADDGTKKDDNGHTPIIVAVRVPRSVRDGF